MCVCVCVCVCVYVCVCVCLSVVCLSVCLYVCLSEHAILAVHAIRSITKDVIVLSVRFAAILKRAFFLKLSYSKVRAFFTHLGRGGHLWLMPTPRAMFRILSVTCLLTRKARAILHKYSIYYTYEFQRFE